MKNLVPAVLAVLAACGGHDATRGAPTDGSRVLFDGKTLGKWKSTEFGGQGEVRVQDGKIVVDGGAALSGIHWTGGDVPKVNYELSVEAMKIEGNDIFCGIAFPYKESFCSFVAGGWGGSTVGLSSVDGMNASENETNSDMDFQKDRWYTFRLRVTNDKIEAWIDAKQVVNLETKDRKVSIHPAMELSCPLGLATYTTTAAFRNIRLRPL